MPSKRGEKKDDHIRKIKNQDLMSLQKEKKYRSCHLYSLICCINKASSCILPRITYSLPAIGYLRSANKMRENVSFYSRKINALKIYLEAKETIQVTQF